MRSIDLRSDTVTRPTPAMRRAMADAEVGDDYYGDDPTVRALEERAATLLGKPAAMLVLSGTMGNLVCLLAHGRRGDAALMTAHAHIFQSEAGHIAALAGMLPTTIPVDGPAPTPAQVTAAIRPPSVVAAPLRLLCLENTHNAAGGRCITAEAMAALVEVAHANGLKVHIDGARLLNASVALGVSPARLVGAADSITFCLTKGLACPVGSLIAGDVDFIARARHHRQMVGGGMRQAGSFAAAGLVGLDTMVDRLAEDHANARRLGVILTNLGFRLDPPEIETNIVFAEPPANIDAMRLADHLNRIGVLVNPPKGRRLRFLTHADVSAADIAEAGTRIESALRTVGSAFRMIA